VADQPQCPCCGQNLLSRRILVVHEILSVGFPDIEMVSGDRCPKHNVEVGGSSTSGHLPIWGETNSEAVAIDERLKHYSAERRRQLVFAAIRNGAHGVGLLPHGAHIDFKPRLNLWKPLSEHRDDGKYEYFF